jgi:hypothetical protein
MKLRHLSAACLVLASGCLQETDVDSAGNPIEIEGQVQALDGVLAADGREVAKLGQGFDSVRGEFKEACRDYDANEDGRYDEALVDDDPGDGVGALTRTVDYASVQKDLGIHADARGSYGAYNGSASMNFSRSLQTNDYQSLLIYYVKAATVKFTGHGIAPLAKEIRCAAWDGSVPDATGVCTGGTFNSVKFAQMCGDQYVKETRLGGEYYLLVKMTFATKSEKVAMDGHLMGTSGTNEVNVDMRSLSQSFNANTRVEMQAFQRGGNTANLASAFSGKVKGDPTILTLQDEKDLLGGAPPGTSAALPCGLSDMESCYSFLDAAIAYGTNINDASSFPRTVKDFPATLSYFVKDWTSVPELVDADDDKASDVVYDARAALLDLYHLNIAVENRATYLKSVGYLTTLESFRQTADNALTNAQRNLGIITRASSKCFDFPRNGTAAEKLAAEAACTRLVSKGTVRIKGRDERVENAGLRERGYIPVSMAALNPELTPTPTYGRADYYTSRNTGLPASPPGENVTYRRWGEWTSTLAPNTGFAMCPPGQWAYSLAMKVETYQGTGDGDDTALNWIDMRCATRDRGTTSPLSPKYPTSTFPEYQVVGTQHPHTPCDFGFLQGVNVFTERYQGERGNDGHSHDDSGANKVIGHCESGTIEPIGGMEWGDPGTAAMCPEGTAVCGYDLQIERRQYDGDDSGLSDIAIACCILP